MNKTLNLQMLKNILNNDDNVILAFIFGSAATKKFKKKSDIDLAIYFKQPPLGMQLLKQINFLSEITNKNIDLVVLNNASILLKHQVMKNKINLIIKNKELYRKLRENIISKYEEYKYVSGMNIYDR